MGRTVNLNCFIVGLFTVIHFCKSEFVPVYMWGTQSFNEPVSALGKISQNSFKNDISEEVKNNPSIIVFVEQSLSPEDFGQRDRLGNTAFNYLSKVRKTSKATYLPYVQNPLKAIKHFSEDIFETTIEELSNSFQLPNSKIIIVALNDAKENEQRFDMLKRHDSFIASAYEYILEKNTDVLAVYTAHHTSWIGSGEVHSRVSRSLLATEANSSTNQLIMNDTILYYTSGNASVTYNSKVSSIPINYSATKDSNSTVVLTGENNAQNIRVVFNFTVSATGYWYLQKVNITYGAIELGWIMSSSIYAPLSFSYACGNQIFQNSTTFSIVFPNFQVEPIFTSGTYLTKLNKFDDPYNCVGFTTIPIWSGLFVTFILMIIMSIGLTMMMDIKTMDRFDDAKGKTITINVSE